MPSCVRRKMRYACAGLRALILCVLGVLGVASGALWARSYFVQDYANYDGPDDRLSRWAQVASVCGTAGVLFGSDCNCDSVGERTRNWRFKLVHLPQGDAERWRLLHLRPPLRLLHFAVDFKEWTETDSTGRPTLIQRRWKLLVPFWVPTGLLLLAPTLAIRRALRTLGRHRRGDCLHCGYNLRGNLAPGRCPECGTPAPDAPAKPNTA